MGFFSGLEGGLEKYIEGFFRDKFKGRVQPLDIAKRLAREMRDRKRVSVNLVYAPNEYEVHLNAEDWDSISYLAEALSTELQDYLRQKAGEKEFTLVGPPRVKFYQDEGCKPGQLRVSGKFGEGSDGVGDPETAEFEDTLSYRPIKDTAPVSVINLRLRFFLDVREGPLAGKVFRLENYPMVVGRRDSCDIVLPDESVSRRHVRFEPQKGGWVVTDLDSSNGTFVNGVRIRTTALSPGDTVKIGATLCVFKVDQ